MLIHKYPKEINLKDERGKNGQEGVKAIPVQKSAAADGMRPDEPSREDVSDLKHGAVRVVKDLLRPDKSFTCASSSATWSSYKNNIGKETH